MKNIPLKIVIAAGLLQLLALSLSADPKSWILCNDPDIDADFQTFQDAHDTASPGDIIHVIGTGFDTDYGEAVIEKPLILVGPGYHAVELGEFDYDNPKARFLKITVNPNAAGTEIYGLQFHWEKSGWSGIYIKASNVTIARNIFTDDRSQIVFAEQGIRNIKIIQNWAWNIQGYNGSAEKVTIANNYVMKAISGIKSGTIENNVVRYNISASGSRIRNNVIFESNNYPLGGSNFGIDNVVDHNLVSGHFHYGRTPPPPPGTGNQDHVDMSQVFKNYDVLKERCVWCYTTYLTSFLALCNNPEYNLNWVLNPDGPAHSAGTEQSEPGMFGGSSISVISGRYSPPCDRGEDVDL